MRTVFISCAIAAIALGAVAQEPYSAAIVIEPTTGQVLYEKNPHQPFPTASMIKMMTLLVVMDHIKEGNLTLETPVTVSAKASKMGGSQVYLKQGETFTVRDLIAATMVHSANDAAVALAEHVSGTDQAFVVEMRQKAEELGLKNTQIHSPHGLPPSPGAQTDVMSPSDLAIVGIEVMKDPLLAEMATVQTMPFRDGVFTMYNPNRLLKMYPHATGIKTGYTVAAGFCVTASAKRGDLELIAVVMGSQKKNDNFESAAKLFSEAFAQYQMVPLVKKGTVMTTQASVKGGASESVRVVAAEDVKLLLKKGEAKSVSLAMTSSGASAPVKQYQQVATILVKQGDKTLQQIPALALNEVPKQSLLKRLLPF